MKIAIIIYLKDFSQQIALQMDCKQSNSQNILYMKRRTALRKQGLSTAIGIESIVSAAIISFLKMSYFNILIMLIVIMLVPYKFLKFGLKMLLMVFFFPFKMKGVSIWSKTICFQEIAMQNLISGCIIITMSRSYRIIAILLVVFLPTAINETQQSPLNLNFIPIKGAQLLCKSRKIFQRESYETEIDAQGDNQLIYIKLNNKSKILGIQYLYLHAKRLIPLDQDNWDEQQVWKHQKYFLLSLGKDYQMKPFLAYVFIAFLTILSMNSTPQMKKTTLYLLSLYLFVTGVSAQAPTMTPVCYNCPGCTISNTCYYCIYNYYISGSCFLYNTMPGCTEANGRYCISCNSSYYLNPSFICVLCSSTIPNCQNCPSPSYCSQCIAGYFFNPLTLSCQNCSLNIYGCYTCISKFICTTCVNQSLFVNVTSKCQLCSIKRIGCYRCTSTVCLQCFSSYFLSNSTCYFCNNISQGCATCISISVCTSCVSTAYAMIGSTCVSCGSLFPFCFNCTASVCQICDPNFFLNVNLQCQCKKGSLIDGECIDVAGCNAAIKYNNNSYCTQCDQSMFKFNTASLRCDCKIGFLLNNMCSTLYGCISMILDSHTQNCLMCNKNRHFTINNTWCSCDYGYFLHRDDNNCYQTCGDGILLYLQCDDGNLVDGDGCSRVCEIEDDFVCIGGNQTWPSKCLSKIGNFRLSVEEIENVGEYNVGKFQFRIGNFDEFLYTLNWSRIFSLEINQSHIVSNISSVSNKVVFIVEYFEDLEGLPATLHLNLDSQYFLNPKVISLPFKMVSQTAPLVISQYPSQALIELFSNILFALSIIALILLLFSPCFHKMIALETFVVLQLCNMAPFLVNGDSLVIRVFSNLYLANGYGRQLFANSIASQTFGRSFEYMSLPKTFTENMLINESFLIVAVAILIVAYCLKDYIKNKDKQKRKIKENIRHFVNFYCCNLVFSVSMSLYLIFCLSLNCNNQRVYEKDYKGKLHETTLNYTIVNQSFNFLSLLIVSFLIATIGFMNIFAYSSSLLIIRESNSQILQFLFKQFERVSVKNEIYVALFLVNMFVSFGILTCLFLIDTQWKVFIYLLVNIPYFFFVVIYRPYTSFIDNLGICLGQFISLIFITGICFKQYFRIIKTPMNLHYQFYFCIAVSSLLTLFVATSVLRCVIIWHNNRLTKPSIKQRKNSKHRKQSYEKVDNRYLDQQKPNHYLKLLSFQQIEKITNPQLIKLKEKLRNNLYEKRVFEGSAQMPDSHYHIREALFKSDGIPL